MEVVCNGQVTMSKSLFLFHHLTSLTGHVNRLKKKQTL